MSFQHLHPGYEHVTLIALGVVSRALIEDPNDVLHVMVHEMQPEVGETGIPPRIYLNHEVDGRGRPRECHNVPLRNWEGQWMR